MHTGSRHAGSGRDHRYRWGVILAGGDGVRLRPLTRFISGDDRPKQFCRLFGARTLLGQTRSRIKSSISRERTLVVLTGAHERFYTEELSDIARNRMIVQPENRGTLPAILCALLRIVQLDEDASVGFFPSDHHYADEKKLLAGIESAFAIAHTDPDAVILFGASARHAEVAYGWIEPDVSSGDALKDSDNPLPRVRRFWEKPSESEARMLLERGCLWNTFVMVGRARAFLAMIQLAAPGLYDVFASLPLRSHSEMAAEALAEVYSRIAAADFSEQVLSAHPDNLTVLSLGDLGWSDLGDPQRAVSTLSRHGAEVPWIAPWYRSLAASAG
jgi:mannose-1-phosphate guanylyltransferase